MITSTIYASRMLGGSVAVAALGAGGAGGATPMWRFVGILVIAVAALATVGIVAPARAPQEVDPRRALRGPGVSGARAPEG
jgi:hypothetical protein